jgi:hypothetical protein
MSQGERMADFNGGAAAEAAAGYGFLAPGDKQRPLAVGFAFFNQSQKDRKEAKAGFIRRFGPQEWERQIQPFVDSGIMGLLSQRETPEARWFVEVVSFLVNRRLARREPLSEETFT